MDNTVNTAPVGQLKTNKGLLKTILLSLITFGIYPLVVMSAVSNDINIVASRYDGKNNALLPAGIYCCINCSEVLC